MLEDLVRPLGDFRLLSALCAFLFALDLAAYLPLFSVFFGRAQERNFQGRNTMLVSLIGAVWLASVVALASADPVHRLLGCLGLYGLFRHHYIDRRWSSIRRGAGAPGFMSHWAVVALLLLQASAFLDASGTLTGQVLALVRFDFAVIMICAGTYKYMVGFLRDDGMEYGRVNPMWGYFWSFFRRRSPYSLQVRFDNWAASLVEFAAGVAMLFPASMVGGALAISLSFFYVACSIRLGRLAFLMAVLPMLFFPGMAESAAVVPFHLATPAWILLGLGALARLYCLVLPLVKFMQYYNLFANRTLPQPLQSWLTRYANLVPIIMWRVFTPDVTNFFIRVYEVDPVGGTERPLVHEDTSYNYFNWNRPWFKLRMLHVTESIALTSVFTTLKYFPSKPELFEQKLVAYARSLAWSISPRPGFLRFEYVSITKAPTHFDFTAVGSFLVDLTSGYVERRALVDDFDYSKPSKYSPIRESAGAGDYARREVRT